MKKLLIILVLLLFPSLLFAGESYSGGSKGYSPSAKSYSAKPATISKSYTSVSPYKPKSGAFDKGAAAAQKQAESKSSYIKGNNSKETYRTPTGKDLKIDSSDKKVTQIRNMSHET